MTDFCVIYNDRIFYCSKEELYNKFELVVFANQLSKQLADGRSWTLHKLVLQPALSLSKENILIRRYLSSAGNMELLICILGQFESGAQYGYQIIDGIFQEINKNFCIESITEQNIESNSDFQSLCELLSANHIGTAYEDFLNSYAAPENFVGKNQLVYSGISVNGLPIISQIYEKQSILQITDSDKKSLITTILSGQLATIAANAYIRAQCYVDSIQIKISPFENRFIFFNFLQFGHQMQYNYESLTTGNPNELMEVLTHITKKLNEIPVFAGPFQGILKQYNPIKSDLEAIVNLF
jgi:hypothetical protein